MRSISMPFLALFVTLTGSYTVFAADAPKPLVRAHAHNDYEHARPLLDALDRGFCSVEADIWFLDGEFRVAHDAAKAVPGQTLQKLYLDPLADRVRSNGGRVYPGGPEVILLIDLKNDGAACFAALHEVLERDYAGMLTSFGPKGLEKRAVRAIVSGDRPRTLMETTPVRYAAYDGRPDDIGGGASAEFIPLISDSWAGVFKWHGKGEMPAQERAKLDDIVARSHAEGRLVRFWAIAPRAEMWRVLFDAGVDLINTDDLDGLRDFLVNQGSKK